MKLAQSLAVLALAGCAQTPIVWDKPGGTQAEFDVDKRFCEFEVMKATGTVDATYRTVIVQEMDRAQRQRDLTLSCMRSRGYTQRP